jgi:integrase
LTHNVISKFDFSSKEAVNGLPFSLSKNVRSHNCSVVGQNLNDLRAYSRTHQVGDLTGRSKNLNSATEIKNVAGTSPTASQESKGIIIEFLWWMKKQGYADSTILSRTQTLKRLQRLGAILKEPESVKEIIAQQKHWSEGRKFNVIMAYSTYLQMIGISWQPPRYRKVNKLPFIPLEAEIDQLIAATSKRVSTFLQILKETGVRSGEAYNLNWTDLDYNNCTILVTPEKGSNPRILKLSSKAISMLNNIPKETEKIFGTAKIRSIRRSYQKQRKRIAHKLGNPVST